MVLVTWGSLWGHGQISLFAVTVGQPGHPIYIICFSSESHLGRTVCSCQQRADWSHFGCPVKWGLLPVTESPWSPVLPWVKATTLLLFLLNLVPTVKNFEGHFKNEI